MCRDVLLNNLDGIIPGNMRRLSTFTFPKRFDVKFLYIKTPITANVETLRTYEIVRHHNMTCHALQIINFFATGWERACSFIPGNQNIFNLIFCEMLHDNPEWLCFVVTETMICEQIKFTRNSQKVSLNDIKPHFPCLREKVLCCKL